MIPFDYQRAPDALSAVRAVVGNPKARFLAGGTNLVDHLKLGIVEPELLVDVSGLPLDRVEQRPDGSVRIGATVRNSDLAAHPLIRRNYPMLSEALLAGASGQLRNMATTGGNLLQRTRCVYFQDVSTPCNKRDPGSGCSALGGYSRDNAIFGASRDCVAVHPSDMAVAMAALDATVIVQGAAGERGIPIAEFHRLPGDSPQRDTNLDHGELITAIDLPSAGASARSAYRKVRDRASYAFALVSVAVVVELEDSAEAPVVQNIRIALGGVSHKPWRARQAEETLRGRPATEEEFRAAADTELRLAEPLEGNEFKLPMVRNAMVSVLRALTEGSGR
ncbi:xanthine dehydrogenase family protein subunit M [Saxibacter everestensis]|uniref:Xanthine dehydrogenase family protein subunit M n=1 Tax=Saxibacter everestensis TaxID=2909229 RepID=A0ABY8QXW3_9MICO|nr:xanthine dehydrogenase family protein subunit M [Brevibacteriaceae bacterium ZFBP1038]